MFVGLQEGGHMTTGTLLLTKDPCTLTRFQSVVTVSDQKHAKLYENGKMKRQNSSSGPPTEVRIKKVITTRKDLSN